MAHPGLVIFDLDGTLLDTRMDIARAVNQGLIACGLPTAAERTIVSFVGDGVGRLVDRTLRAVGGDMALAPRVAEALLDFYHRHPVDHTRPYPGIGAVLEALADRPLGVASNKPGALCREILAHFGWADRFVEILGADWGGPRKPDPAPLLRLAERAGVAPSTGVMVGDSVGDIEAGRAAGMRTVAALYGYRPAAELRAAAPDATIETPAELLEALEA
ncbi:MAG: HAD-IA family hydrolase [bacterium]